METQPPAVQGSDFIDCLDLYGVVRKVPRDQVSLRPAAYAVVLHEDRVLLMKMKATGKYHFPGGGIETGERIAETLARELREETGIAVVVERLLHFDEMFFFYNPSGRAYHGLHFFYLCRPLAGELVAEQDVLDGSAEKPAWVPVTNLRAVDFQTREEVIIALERQGLIRLKST